MRIKLLGVWACPEWVLQPQSVVEVTVEVAKQLVSSGQAEALEPFPEKPVEPAPVEVRKRDRTKAEKAKVR